jgi:hypothetical protein
VSRLDVQGGIDRAIDEQGVAAAFARYELWNDAIEAEFFDGKYAGRPVYLDIEDDALARVADMVGAGDDPREAFTRAITPTLHLPPEREGRLLALHARRVRRWRLTNEGSAPPCLAILAFFALAAEGMRGDEHFRANNYYARLAQCLGIDPVARPSDKERIAQDFQRDSLTLWNALNSWLTERDAELGLPTAYAFDWRSYVGVPISQALLREEERLELRKLFLEFRLRPGQELATSDMLRLLKDWVPRADITPELKRLFQQPDVQSRVADIACIELQGWDGSIPGDVVMRGDHATALLLAAQIRRLPRPQLVLNLVIRGNAPVQEGALTLAQHSAEAAVAAFSDTGGRMRLVGAPTEGWRRVETDALPSFPDLLVADVRLESAAGSEVTRKPRRLVILERDEEYRVAVEADRIQLGRDNILLAHKTLSADVDNALANCAREGYRRWDPDELRGLPDEWVAWSDVEVMAIPNLEETPELSALVPLEWTKITIGGGISLPGHMTWLREAPPEVRVASVVDREVTLSLAATTTLDGLEPDEAVLATFRGAAVVSLKSEDLLDGDYRVSLREAGSRKKLLVSAGFRIRSPDSPRPLPALVEDLAYSPGASAPRAALSAELMRPDDEQLRIRGALVRPLLEMRDGHLAVPPRDLRSAAPLDMDAEAELEVSESVARSGDAPACLTSDAHHFRIAPAGRAEMLGGRRRRAGARIDGRCLNCGFEKWFPPRTRRAPAFRRERRREAIPAPHVEFATRPEPPAIAAIPDEGAPGMELLLRALSYAKSGNWSLFERLAGQVGDEPWFAVESARTLASLGHLDLQLDLTTGRPLEWEVSPVVLYPTPAGAVVTGARSERLVSATQADVAALDGELEIVENNGAPATLVVHGIEDDDLDELASSLGAAVDAEVTFNLAGAEGIAATLPTLQSVAEDLPELSWPAVALERFDLDRNKWERVGALDEVGAYKLITRPLRYGFVTSTGRVLCADNRLVKWLAALATGVPLLAYDPNEQLLITRLGSQLPGLYERAAVMCSGRAAEPRVDGTVAYRDVPPAIAQALFSLLNDGRL